MKKQIANFESNSLSRKEMKSLNGGNSGLCKTGACQVVIMKGGQNQGRYDGHCEYSFSPLMITCYCETGMGNMTLGNSNNGISHCTIGS